MVREQTRTGWTPTYDDDTSYQEWRRAVRHGNAIAPALGPVPLRTPEQRRAEALYLSHTGRLRLVVPHG